MIDLTYPRRKRLFLDFKTSEYSRDRGQTSASASAHDKKHLSKISKIGSKNCLLGNSRSSSNPSGSGSASASDKSDARSRESSERDDDYDSSDRIDGVGNPRSKVHDHHRDDDALSNHNYSSTRNGLRRTACKTEVVPQLSAVDFGPKTSRVGIDYQVRAVKGGVV